MGPGQPHGGFGSTRTKCLANCQENAAPTTRFIKAAAFIVRGILMASLKKRGNRQKQKMPPTGRSPVSQTPAGIRLSHPGNRRASREDVEYGSSGEGQTTSMGRPRKVLNPVEVIARRWLGESYRSIARSMHAGAGSIFRCHKGALASLGAFQNAKAAILQTVTDDESRVGTTQATVSSSASDAEES